MHGLGAPLGRFTTDVPDDAVVGARDVANVLQRARRVLVCGHTGADGDVVGSSLGLACALRERGVDVVVYNDEPYPTAYGWLPGCHDVQHALPDDARFDAVVVVDAARDDRLGRSFPPRERRGSFVWIDHHKNDAPPGDVNFIDLTSAAVGEQIAMVLDAMGHALSVDVARCLYASLLSDTGGFRYGNTSARAFRLAARLVEVGVDPWSMTEHIYENQDEARVRLLGRVLDGLWRSPCGRLGIVEVRTRDLQSVGAVEEHLQGLVNHVRGIRGVEVAALLREVRAPHDDDAPGTRVILRSRGNISLAPIAAALGGRGHKNAATVELPMAVEDARRFVVDVIDATFSGLQVTMRPGAAE